MKKFLSVLALTAITATFIPAFAGTAAATPDPKVIVCKYVGTPFESELVQTGQNPISVSINALADFDLDADPLFPQAVFNDQQENSVAVRYATGPTDNGTPGDCPVPVVEDIEVTAAVEFFDPTCQSGAAFEVTEAEGVSYEVEGDVEPGGTVTITATADEGYVIVGESVFEHTFGEVPTDCGGFEPEASAGVEFEGDCFQSPIIRVTNESVGEGAGVLEFVIEDAVGTQNVSVGPGHTQLVEVSFGNVTVTQSDTELYEEFSFEQPTDCTVVENPDANATIIGPNCRAPHVVRIRIENEGGENAGSFTYGVLKGGHEVRSGTLAADEVAYLTIRVADREHIRVLKDFEGEVTELASITVERARNCHPNPPLPPKPEPKPKPGTLAHTGADDVLLYGGIALALMLLGGASLYASRRRRGW